MMEPLRSLMPRHGRPWMCSVCRYQTRAFQEYRMRSWGRRLVGLLRASPKRNIGRRQESLDRCSQTTSRSSLISVMHQWSALAQSCEQTEVLISVLVLFDVVLEEIVQERTSLANSALF